MIDPEVSKFSVNEEVNENQATQEQPDKRRSRIVERDLSNLNGSKNCQLPLRLVRRRQETDRSAETVEVFTSLQTMSIWPLDGIQDWKHKEHPRVQWMVEQKILLASLPFSGQSIPVIMTTIPAPAVSKS